jgi:hypothetical protein
MFYTIGFFVILNPLMYFFSPFYVLKIIKRKLAFKEENNINITQREANLLYENPPLDMAGRYANTNKLLFTSFFYVPILPAVAFIGFFGAFISYWVDKYLLLRRHKVPENFGP